MAATERFTVDPALQLVVGPQFHKKTREGSIFHPAIADTEADGWGRRIVKRDHAKRRTDAKRAGDAVDSSPLNELDFLLAVDDSSRVGALRFQDEELGGPLAPHADLAVGPVPGGNLMLPR